MGDCQDPHHLRGNPAWRAPRPRHVLGLLVADLGSDETLMRLGEELGRLAPGSARWQQGKRY